MEATTYTPDLSEADITTIKQQVSEILIAAGVNVPADDLWTVTDATENKTKVMIAPKRQHENDVRVRHLRGLFFDVKAGKILSYGNNPKRSVSIDLRDSPLEEEIGEGKAVMYRRSEVVQIRLIRALDESGNPKLYFLGNRFINALTMVWSKSAMYGELLRRLTNNFNFESLYNSEDKHQLQYDFILQDSSLQNVSQCPPSSYVPGVILQRIRLAGFHDPAPSSHMGNIPSAFLKPTILDMESANLFLKYGWYAHEKDVIDRIPLDERPGEGVYIDIFKPNGAFSHSLVVSHPSWEVRTKNITIATGKVSRMVSDFEKLWYIEIDSCPVYAKDNKTKLVQDWIKKGVFYGRRGRTNTPITEQTVMWKEGGITLLRGKMLTDTQNYLSSLYINKNFTELTSYYNEQVQYRILMSVSMVRRGEIIGIMDTYKKDKKQLASWFARMVVPVDVSSINFRHEGLYRPNKEEINSISKEITRITEKLKVFRDLPFRENKAAMMMEVEYGRLFHLLIVTYRAIQRSRM